ncbi:hypothetical protein IQ258_19635 [Coleofasciculus sp. LEGE 07081]|uniref:ORC-CDC6 family AAA ATPase n=1 Tax=Coleofasciculus sp. LEGE 07081 TaxID=2777967 RepID=UPI001881F010|nr:hypothetical protein [Coleofasciculus sp. LEGE 07081]MBE9128315.1 hypothetical protein [Coleofasciculus sp. LEGE 07081]
MVNPFEITKASDFNDREIFEYLIDSWGASTFKEVLKPCSPMPKLLLGGKGSGKTHLMRMLAWTTTQSQGHSDTLYERTINDGYFGIYMRCDSLNGSRFSGKGINSEDWHTVYCYCMELRLTELLLQAITALLPESSPKWKDLTQDILQLFNHQAFLEGETMDELRASLRKLALAADRVVANAYRTKSLEIDILFALGDLIYGIPELVTKHFIELDQVRFLYLIDELENLSETQQWFIQSLIRSRKDPCSIIVGGRLYGVRTYQIGPGAEKNVKDSEFEEIVLDELFRKNPDDYFSFVSSIIIKRLELHDFPSREIATNFEVEDSSDLYSKEALRLTDKWDSKGEPRKWVRELQRYLVSQGIFETNSATCRKIVNDLSCKENPVLEMINILSFYQHLSNKIEIDDVLAFSKEVNNQCKGYLSGTRGGWYTTKVSHYHQDMYSQLRRDCKAAQNYLGFHNFVHMSEGLPRNILTLLKNIFEWSKFKGERPFQGGLISAESQRMGVSQASDWFFDDVRDPGPDGVKSRRAVERVAELLRIHRYSLKPVEKTASTFSIPTSTINEEALRMLSIGVSWSLLVEAGSHNFSNGYQVFPKYQISKMIAAKWGLPIVKGGTLEISQTEADVIFGDLSDDSRFHGIRRTWEQRYSPPAGRNRGKYQLPLEFDENDK